MGGDSATAPVIAGLAVGIAFVIVIASLLQAPLQRIRSIEPAPTSPANAQDQIALGGKVKLDDSSWESGISQIVPSDEGRVYVTGGVTVPPPASGHEDSNYLVYFTKSVDGGSTFDQILHMSNTIYSGNTDIKVRGESVYLMWFEHVVGDNSEIFFRKSTDNGSAFGPVVNVSNSDYNSGSNDMEVSKDGSAVYAVWSDYYQFSEPQKSAILFSSSSDGGQSFGPPVALVNTTTSFACPQIAIGENNTTNDTDVYVVWRQDLNGENIMRLFFTVSHDGGRTFSEPVNLRTAWIEDNSCPQLAVYGNDAYLLWNDIRLIRNPYHPSEILVGDSDVMFIAIRDDGRDIEPALNISRGIGAFTTEPEMLVADDGDIYAVWRDTIPIIDQNGNIDYYGNAEVVFAKSEDGGKTFSEPVNLSNTESGSYEPEVAVHADDVYVIWMESTFPSNVAETMMRISNDGGESFSDTISGITGRMEEPFSRPVIITGPAGDKIFIAWSERPDFEDANTDTYVLVGTTP